ncbi:hypothetical protein F6R98_11445 [Candidatus Methylospira mobilis]|uniref:Uncharacterized protein n=1 Tax=Candidatus Methylospira mobilis TaxID=1808979 RepID=A0A5Q0BHX1_9GAMM|nr:hypothetical protein [Candidatus Methylospira mobilis]QFY43159.1 hypothetical protein F6R98_11445 [Candidatus Methylospira mobilis]
MRNGQIKAPGERHEKDHRHRLDDRSRYVLGWSNAEKSGRWKTCAPDRKPYGRTRCTHRRIAGRTKIAQAAHGVAVPAFREYGDFRELDWQPLAMEIAALQQEKRELESASDILHALTERMRALLLTQQDTESRLDVHKDKRCNRSPSLLKPSRGGKIAA